MAGKFSRLLGLAALIGLASAKPTTTAIPTASACPKANGRTIYDSNGAGYLVTCSADNDRGSYTNVRAETSYLDCMTACDADTSKPCVGFTYVGGDNGTNSGTCWLKEKMTTYPSANANVISAVRVSDAPNDDRGSKSSSSSSSSIPSSIRSSAASSARSSAASSSSKQPSTSSLVSTTASSARSSAISTTTKSSSSTAQSSSSSSAVPSTSGNLCPSYNFTTYADTEDNNWQILCGFDTSPSSFGVVDVSSFALCLEACNAKDGCVSVSYFGTACYFKKGFENSTPSKNVNSAYIINRANYPVPSRNDIYAGRGCGASLPAGVQAGGRTTQFSINSGGLNRSFSIHVPSSYDINSAAPLIMAFHDRSETPVNIERYSDLSSEVWNPYGIVVYPLGFGSYPQWQSDPDAVEQTPYVDDQTFVQDLLVHMTSNYCIDTTRILATGYSNGGGLAGILACNSSLSNQFSAFAISSGAQYTNLTSANCPQNSSVPSTILTNTILQPVCSPGRRNVPMLEFHGDADGTVSYDGGPRRGYCLPTIPHWISDWSVRNGYSTANVATPLADGQVTRYEYGTANNQGIVTHYKIAGGKHAWFSQDTGSPIDATPIILEFLYRYRNYNALRYIPAPASPPVVSSAAASSTSAAVAPSFTASSPSAAFPSASNSSSIVWPTSYRPSAAAPSVSVNVSLSFNTSSSIAIPLTTAASSLPLIVSLPLNTSTSVAIPLTTAASPPPVNISLPLNTSSVAAVSTATINITSTIISAGTAGLSSTFSTISTQAPFANTTVPTNTTLPAPAATGISCPASNNTLYTDPSTGSTFEVQCNDDNTATASLVNLDAITVEGATFQQCMSFCAMMAPTCQGVTMSGDTCYLERTSAGRTPGLQGARLISHATR
ncbi:hypothetical protein D6D27_02961 [Aureobasidium pullulans]|nr:hypothetical protein D6D27_02961 [Aureobasidium pullulans]